MNEEDLQILERWIAAERALGPAMREARIAHNRRELADVKHADALKAFSTACQTGGAALAVLRKIGFIE